MKNRLLTLSLLLALPFAAHAEKSAYLGVATSELSPALKAQLDIPHGVVVADVMANSPAAKSLAKHDILTKLDDQKLVNPPQFVDLMKTHKKGDTVTIQFIRGGKSESAKIVLGEREKTTASSGADSTQSMTTSVVITPEDLKVGDAEGLTIHLKEAIEKAQNQIDVKQLNQQLGGMDIDLEKILKDAGVMSIKVLGPDGKVAHDGETSISVSSNISSASAATTVWNDNGVTYQITTSNGKKAVKVSENGKVLYEGPFNTEEEIEKVPKQHRKKLDEIQSSVKVISVQGVEPKKRKAKEE